MNQHVLRPNHNVDFLRDNIATANNHIFFQVKKNVRFNCDFPGKATSRRPLNLNGTGETNQPNERTLSIKNRLQGCQNVVE